MNSTDFAYSPPLAETDTKPSLRPRSPDADGKEKPAHIRFLLSNNAAGSIIGKGGSTITEFQSQSGARIKLSRNHEFFPGTSDRIITITGELSEISRATELILEKLLNEAEENSDDNRTKVRLIVPNSSCGAIIGKGGSTIKSLIEESQADVKIARSLIEESQADIKISPQENKYAGFHDRIVTVTGSLEEHMRAIVLIISKLAEDAHYTQSMNSPFSYGAHTSTNNGHNGVGGKHTSIKGKASARSQTETNGVQDNSTTLGVPDERIGAVVGRGGRIITEISQASGAKIKISDRGDFMAGTSDRKVTITGTPEAIRSAEAMIMQRVSANSD